MSSSGILIGKWGKIVAGENAGWYVFIEDDKAGDTGGLFVYTCSERSLGSGVEYDDWVQNRDEIPSLFRAMGWQIEWLESAA